MLRARRLILKYVGVYAFSELYPELRPLEMQLVRLEAAVKVGGAACYGTRV